MKQYVSYLRVSTTKQGQSGLGLEAQRQAVQAFVKDAPLLAEFVEVESGKKDQRPQLTAAIAYAKANGAVLTIAKLDRLSRNASFIMTLRDTGVDFVACDLPDANTLTVGIFAVMAQHERELISKRTKDALAAKKARGEKMGTPENLHQEAIRKGVVSNREVALNHKGNLQATHTIVLLREKGLNYSQIAQRLNELGYKTRRGHAFGAEQVKRLYLRATTPSVVLEFKFKNAPAFTSSKQVSLAFEGDGISFTSTLPTDTPAVSIVASNFKFKNGHFDKYLPLVTSEEERIAISYLNELTSDIDEEHMPCFCYSQLTFDEVVYGSSSNLKFYLRQHDLRGVQDAFIAGVMRFTGAYWLDSGGDHYPSFTASGK